MKAGERTGYAGLYIVGTYLDEDLPRLNENTAIIDAQFKQAAEERELEGQVRADRDAALQAALENEAGLREAGDIALQGAVTREEGLREAGETALQEALEAEAARAAAHVLLGVEEGAHGFPLGREGQILAVRDGRLTWADRYVLGEFYLWRHPTLQPGFQPAYGGLLANAATLYPEAWAYLQTSEGQKLCTTEANWQALTRAVWHTNADGTQVGWNGIGGAPYYAPDTATGALRLPDLRGMYAEAAGFDALGVGGVHGDGIRNIQGGSPWISTFVGDFAGASGAMYGQSIGRLGQWMEDVNNINGRIVFDASRVVPVAAKNVPCAWGALPCVYLGQEAS